jgi:NAD(P)-dependent dehydrogenase (short-subunit alcohol dehydrogenase family)
MRGIEGRRFVVAGGATGIGAATAKRLAEEGGKVIAGDINKAGLEKTVAEITAAGGIAKGVPFDLADEASCNALIQACVDAYGGVEGLANVGADLAPERSARDLDLLDMSDDIWKRFHDVNLLGYTRTIRAALPHFIAQKNGAIVNTSSAAAFIGEDTRPAYATSKVAIHAMSRHVARRWGRDNVRCNVIAPGPTLTEGSVNYAHLPDFKAFIASTPLQRAGTMAEVAAAMTFLLSDDGAWVTGQVWSIGGGQVMRE